MNVRCFWLERLEGGQYRRTDTGDTYVRLAEAPAGAMWDAPWMHDHGTLTGGFLLGGPNVDGRFIIVRLPNGHDWMIDSRASNCTLPNDNDHRCWIRHGEPPKLTVDKNGKTCNAGAGSIRGGNWHGFLRNGELVQA